MRKPKSQSVALPTLPAAIEALAESTAFTGTTSLALAGRIMMAQHTRKLYDHLPGVLSGDDPHDIHQMRVATRRLRASLQSTVAAYRPEIVGGVRKRLRTLARALGAVRDLDVMLIRLRNDAEQEAVADRRMLDAAIERLQAERATAHADLIDELRRKRTTRLLRALNDFLLCPLEEVQADADDLPLLVRHYAGSTLWREYEAVQRFETVMPGASSEQLHQLRIACKHLRYTLELFAPALAANARSLIKQVEAMQEHLGQIHDVDVALAHLGLNHHDEHAPESTNDGPVAAAESAAVPDAGVVAEPAEAPPTYPRSYAAIRLAERSKLIEEFDPMWQRWRGEKNRSKLIKLLVEL